jgi:heat shock protein HtpX
MEMCVDNPREEFSDLFATHPSIERRVEAIIKFAGGHDPGPLALPEAGAPMPEEETDQPADAPAGPWGRAGGGSADAQAGASTPFLPGTVPGNPAQDGGAADEGPGPWGPHGGR